jgi:hypothetical protein
VEGKSGVEVREAVRKNCGIVLALFRNRLTNSYCNKNMRLQGIEEAGHHNGWHSKYQLALAKGFGLEFRLPSKVESVKQLIRRYELFYELLDFSINNPDGTHAAFLKKIRPIVLSMYNRDEAKTNEILALAENFRKFIVDGIVSEEIARYV